MGTDRYWYDGKDVWDRVGRCKVERARVASVLWHTEISFSQYIEDSEAPIIITIYKTPRGPRWINGGLAK